MTPRLTLEELWGAVTLLCSWWDVGCVYVMVLEGSDQLPGRRHVKKVNNMNNVSWGDSFFLSTLWVSCKSIWAFVRCLHPLSPPTSLLTCSEHRDHVTKVAFGNIQVGGKITQIPFSARLFKTYYLLFFSLIFFFFPVLIWSETMQNKVAHLNTKNLRVLWYSQNELRPLQSLRHYKSGVCRELACYGMQKAYLWVFP